MHFNELVYIKRRYKTIVILVIVIIYCSRNLGNPKFNRSTFSNDSNDRKSKHVICIVLTSEKTITTRGVAVWNTWGKDCNKIIFACSCMNIKKYNQLATDNGTIPDDFKQFSIVANYPILHLNVDEDYNKMGEKVVLVLKEVYKLYKTRFEWYFLVDDDAYVFVGNLNKFVEFKNASEPFYYGHVWNVGFKWNLSYKWFLRFNFSYSLPYSYISGGPGTLFTNESFSRLVTNFENQNCEKYMNSFGDLTIGKCANEISISIGNSNDKENMPLFYPFNQMNPLKREKACCSLDTISIHYVNFSEMYYIHANKNDFKRIIIKI